MIPAVIKRHGLPVAGGAMVVGLATVGHFEGKRNDAYLDPIGIPTICYGHTQGVRLGQSKTDVQCRTLLKGELGEAFEVVDRAVERPLPPTREAALASFVYNVGAGAFQRSTLLRKLNAGDVIGACNELSRWVYAGGRQLAGLIKRRAVERALCLMGTGETRLAGDTQGDGA